MSGYSDDYEAAVCMLEQAWRRLREVDPGNKWLKYFDPAEVSLLNMEELISEVWDTQSFDRTNGRMIHLMARYTARLEAQSWQPVRALA